MTKIKVIKKDNKKRGDELLLDVFRRIIGLIISFIGIAIGIFAGILLAQSFTPMTFFVYGLPLFAVSFFVLVLGTAFGRSVSWKAGLKILIDILRVT